MNRAVTTPTEKAAGSDFVAGPQEVTHVLCTTCYPRAHEPDGKRVALRGTDMRDEREVVGGGKPCGRCTDVSRHHWHGPRGRR